MSEQPIIQVDFSDLQAFQRQLHSAAQRAINEAWKVLMVWGEEYRRRVQRVTPVATGRMSQSWVLIPDRANLSITIGNTIKGKDGKPPYPVYLEFGTERIAGGRVKRWQDGQPPIMSWPAKSAELPVMPRFGTKAYERYENTLTMAFTAGQGEQMPMLRPIGHEIAPKVAEDVLHAFARGFESAVQNRRQQGS